MDALTGWIALPLGVVMQWCYSFINNYGVAIVLFTFLSKIILLPLSVWIQKNSIIMVKMQPELNRIKARYFGDPDTIAEEESKLYKKNKYSPLATLIPLVVQIVLLLGVVAVIYNPMQYLFHLDSSVIDAICARASELSGVSLEDSAIQLTAIELIKANPVDFAFCDFSIIENLQNFDLMFLGFDLSANPSVALGITLFVPVIAGGSAFLLCVAQNASNVLQAEQGKLNKWGTTLFSVGLSLYLGFFVPAGIALYWVASNVFAIIQLYALNAVIPPKKFVDYEALEESRKELKALQELGGKKKMFERDENAKRERADYKRFFSVNNKHLVFYSERSGFYKYYKEIIEYLLKKTSVRIHYITNDPNDVIFELARQNEKIIPYYISVKKMVTLMMKLEADIVVMTTPDLDNYYLKRSLMKKDIEYIFVPHDPSSMHMGFKEHSLDNFDTVFATGKHILAELRASEKLYNTKEKTVVEFGYPLIEDLIESCEKLPKEDREQKQILIAPSWQEDNLLDSCIDEMINSFFDAGYKVIVRPHPEYVKRYSPKLSQLKERFADKEGENLIFEFDFSSNVSVYSSDLLVTDWSGIGIEFGFATLKPVIFVNTKIKMENENYHKIGIEPQEIRLRNVLGKAIDKEEVKNIAQIANEILTTDAHCDMVKKEREEYFYSLGSHGVNGAKYIIKKLVKK